MDQYPAQSQESLEEGATDTLSSSYFPNFSSFRQFFPLITIIGIILLFAGGILGFLLIRSQQASLGKITPSPVLRPTATPFPPPTIPLVATPTGTSSASIMPAKIIDRLIFIRDGDIYQSDLSKVSLLVKNITPAADKLSWSPAGNYLAWRIKSATATPSALTVYKRKKDSSFTIRPIKTSSAELIDYAWSPDEEKLALLIRNSFFQISLFSLASPSSSPVSTLINREASIKQLFWPKDKKIVFSGSDGISSIDVDTSAIAYLINNKNVFKMKLAPDKSKILYSIGDKKNSDLYTINLDGSNNYLIPPTPVKVDMGETNLPHSVLKNGFIPYAVWFPSGDKLLVGYHYLPALPLVGIYDLNKDSFLALAPILISEKDLMIDDSRLLGVRVNTTSGTSPFWQLSLFTLENNVKLTISRVIPNAYSPAYFFNYADYR